MVGEEAVEKGGRGAEKGRERRGERHLFLVVRAFPNATKES